MEIFTFDQRSEDWIRARLGLVTASEYHTVLAHGKRGAPSVTRRTLMLKLLGERLTDEPAERYSNAHMERGRVMEDEARDLYCMVEDVEPERVGFIRNGETGCSPDSLIGTTGMVEIKTKLPHLQLDCLLRDQLPPEHRAQCQGQLWIAEREWVDLVSYWPGLPLFVKRVHRDEEYIKQLKVEVDTFNAELLELETRIKAYKRDRS